MSLRCGLCGYSDFRRSRLRMADAFRLLALQHPVRCRRCGERTYAFVLRIPKLNRDAVARHGKALPG